MLSKADGKPLVYFSVLNMGLGHAARSLPLIKSFLKRDWEVLVGSNGRALDFLKRELPGIPVVTTPDYGLRYANGIWLMPALLRQLPRLISRINREKRFTRRIVETYNPRLIVSDHCYGAYDRQIPAVFIAHQLVLEMPAFLNRLRNSGGMLHRKMLRHFDKILIPDIANGRQGLLSGRLSELPPADSRFAFIGLLSSLAHPTAKSDRAADVFISISGPEPQRSVLEDLVLHQVESISGKVVVALGRAEEHLCLQSSKNLHVFTHLDRRQFATAMTEAAVIVARPGYTTLMELAFLGKPALLIPTPGQTEQVYLAEYHRQQGFYQVCNQQDIDLPRQIEAARLSPGLMIGGDPADTVEAFWNQILPLIGGNSA